MNALEHRTLIRLILAAYDPGDELEPREKSFMVKQVVHSLAMEGTITQETADHIHSEITEPSSASLEQAS